MGDVALDEASVTINQNQQHFLSLSFKMQTKTPSVE
jgi:hypothetical protein